MLKKYEPRSKPIVALAFLLLYGAACVGAFPQTVRSIAEKRFSALGWATKADEGADSSSRPSVRSFELGAANPDGASSLSQDTHLFPTAPIAAISSGKAVPPILPGAGSLDFSSAPAALISLFENMAASLKTRDYSKIKTTATSSFMPIMLGYMMRRLPQAESAAFAGVEMAADGGSARATLRLNLAGSDEAVFATVEAVLEEGEWRAADVIFDGDSYGKAAKPPRK